MRILFVKSEVEVYLRKRNRFSTKYLTGRKKTWVGIICGVVPLNLKILWNSRPLFYGIECLRKRNSQIRFHKKYVGPLWNSTKWRSRIMKDEGCARHRSVYVYIIVKGSRVCKHCNVLDVVSMYVLVWYKATLPLLI